MGVGSASSLSDSGGNENYMGTKKEKKEVAPKPAVKTKPKYEGGVSRLKTQPPRAQ